MFAPKVKQGPTRVDSKTIAGTKDVKGKGRAKVPDSEEDEGEVKEGKNDEDEEDEEDDESDSEPEDVGRLCVFLVTSCLCSELMFLLLKSRYLY